MISLKFFLNLLIIAPALSIIPLEIYRRVAIERKRWELLLGIHLKRNNLYRHIDPDSIPNSKNGREFSEFYKIFSLWILIILGIGLCIIGAARITLEFV